MTTNFIHQRDFRMKMKDALVVKLACGCTRKQGLKPFPGQKFCCPGAGHGYQLTWMFWKHPDDPRTFHNPEAT